MIYLSCKMIKECYVNIGSLLTHPKMFSYVYMLSGVSVTNMYTINCIVTDNVNCPVNTKKMHTNAMLFIHH